MDDLASQVQEWKVSQSARLPRVELPCRTCQKQLEIDFDPPERCPTCGAQFLGKPAQRRSIQNILIALAIVALVAGLFTLRPEPQRDGATVAAPDPDAGGPIAVLLQHQGFVVFVTLAVIAPIVYHVEQFREGVRLGLRAGDGDHGRHEAAFGRAGNLSRELLRERGSQALDLKLSLLGELHTS